YPALHAHDPTISAASEAMAPLQRADPPFRAGAPSKGRSNAPRAGFSALPRQHHAPHSVLPRDLIIPVRGKGRIRDRQTRRMPEELRMTHQRGLPQRPVGDPRRAYLVVRDELGLGLLNLDQLPELGQLGRLSFADGLRMGLEETEHLVAVVRVPAEHAGA